LIYFTFGFVVVEVEVVVETMVKVVKDVVEVSASASAVELVGKVITRGVTLEVVSGGSVLNIFGSVDSAAGVVNITNSFGSVSTVVDAVVSLMLAAKKSLNMSEICKNKFTLCTLHCCNNMVGLASSFC
jgi:hypothetical protein